MSDNLPPAYCFYKIFEPEPRKAMRFDRHYLLYAAKGTVRLEAQYREWILPPARAAWIPANTDIHIETPHQFTCCSVLFHTDFIVSEIEECQVLNLNDLAREMILYTRKWGPENLEFDDHAKSFFRALSSTCAQLTGNPSQVWIPKGRSKELKRALKFTRQNIANSISLGDVANAAHLSERTLARRFAGETQMTWRQIQRRMRMIYAMELLSNVHGQIINIAYDVGYDSLSAFNRAFLDFSGTTPTQFRNQYFANSAEKVDATTDSA